MGREPKPIQIVGAGHFQQTPPVIPHGPPVVNFARYHKLPLLCRLRGHGWRASTIGRGWYRQTCRRCRGLNVKVEQ